MKRLTRSLAGFKRVPLQAVLVVPFVVQIFAVVGLTGWLSLKNGQAAVNDVAAQLRQETTARIQQKLTAYLETPHLINQINADALRLGQLDLKNTALLERHFWHQMQLFPSVTSVFLGTEMGDFVAVGLPGDGKVLKIGVVNRETGNRFHVYGINAQGQRTRLEEAGPPYDPRQRPWYQSAAKTQQPTWSEIYTDFADPRLTLTAGQPFYDPAGRLKGVLATDLLLSQVGDFLRSLKIGRSGQTFIMERSGFLVAGSTMEQPFLVKGNQAERIEAVHSTSPLIQASARYLRSAFGDLRQIDRTQQLSFDLDRQKQFLQVTPLRDGRGLDWLIVVVVPETDFMERIQANNEITALLCLASLIVASVAGFLTSRWITRPILRLSEAARLFSEEQQEQIVSVNRRDELGQLARTFNEMQMAIARERRLFIGGPVVVFRWSTERNWAVEYVSPNVTQFGYRPEDFTSGQVSYASIIHPGDIARIAAELATYEADRVISFEQDYRIFRADGTVRWVYDYTVPVRNSQGKVISHEGYILDITERKQAEEALRQSEATNRALIAAIPDLLIRATGDGTYLDIAGSDRVALQNGGRFAVGSNVRDSLPLNQAELRMQKIYQALQTGEMQVYEQQFTEGDRTRFEEVRVIVIRDNEVLIMVRDITERKEAEVQIRASAERDRLLAEVATRIRNSLNLNQIFNTTVVEIHQLLQVDRVYIGYMDGLRGQVVAESVDPDCPSVIGFTPSDELLQELESLFQGGGVQVINDIWEANLSPIRAKAFAEHQTRSSLSAPILVNDRFYGLLVAQTCKNPRNWQPFEIELIERLSIQVTIAVQQAQLFQQIQTLNVGLERQVEERTAQLRQKMEELQDLYQRQDEFLHAVSHDLRTPLMGMLMVLRNLQNQADASVPVSRNILDRMIQSCDRQLNLINSILETHYGDVKGISLQCEWVHLEHLIQSIAADIESLLHKNQATLTCKIAPGLPLIVADPLQLRRVFENLLSNALNHNPPGLHLTMQAQVENSMVYCVVADDGVGMSQEQSAQLFERYVRGSRVRSTGVGLGLYLCRQIITAHGGEIGIQSPPGKGATFWFTLPIVPSSRTIVENQTTPELC
ncbi:MAG: cache domain-containing protein [Leptolyngbyaceae cyanobacterium bins.59]|nr:cache domain-containing protein [Leptolyngbyaceae cyanobacterium bins.59]